MADQNYEIATKIGWTSDDAKLKDVGAQLEKLNATTAQHIQQQAQAKTATEQHGGALDGLKGKVVSLIAQFVGFAAVVRLVWDSFKGAVEEDKLLTQLAANTRLLGHATDAQVISTRAWVFEMQKAAGLDKNVLIPALTQTMAVTRDVSSAQRLVEISAGAAARGIGEFEGNVTALSRAIATGTIRGVGPFQNLLRDLIKTTGDLGAATVILYKDYGDAGAAVETAAMKMARAKVAWQETKDAIGGIVMDTGVTGEGSLLKAFSKGLVFIAGGLVYTTTLVVSFITHVKTLGLAIKDYLTGNFKKAKWEIAGFGDTIIADLEKAQAHVQKMTKDVNDAWDKSNTHVKTGQEQLAKDIAIIREKMKKPEEKLQTLPKARPITDVDAIDPLTGMPFKVEEKMVKEALARQVEEWRKNAEKVDKIHKELASKYKNWTMAELQAKIDELREIEATEMTSAQTQERIEAVLVNAKAKLDQASMLDATKFALSQFGNVKGVAVAQALINTYEGATKALSAYPPPFSFIAAAAVIAAGLMQVKQITQTEPGIAGGASAGAASATMPPMVYTGAPTAPSPVSTTSVQSTVNQPSNITINTLTGDGAVQTARQFQRILRPGSRSYDRGIVNRKATTIGGGGQ
jgi:hypothetical protein